MCVEVLDDIEVAMLTLNEHYKTGRVNNYELEIRVKLLISEKEEEWSVK